MNGRTDAKVDAAVTRLGGAARGVAAEPGADIVVSNLGTFQPADFFDTDDAVWDRHWQVPALAGPGTGRSRHWQVNVMAGIRLARTYLPGMEAKGWGRSCCWGRSPPSTSRPR